MRITKVDMYNVVRVINDKNEQECLFLTDHELKRIRHRSRSASEPIRLTFWRRFLMAWKVLWTRK